MKAIFSHVIFNKKRLGKGRIYRNVISNIVGYPEDIE